MHHEAAAVAAIFSRDSLVAEAALLPLCQSIPLMDHGTRDKYERLFHLIVEQSLSQGGRGGAQSLIESRFRAGEIRDLEAQLGRKLSPARLRYRDFLTVVKKLMDRNMSSMSLKNSPLTSRVNSILASTVFAWIVCFGVLMCRSLLKSFCRWSFLSIRR